MTALIWMLVWLPQVLPAMSKLPRPVNVEITSVYFTHVLKWEPGPGTPPGVYYHVTMATYRASSWVPVAGCERVQHPLVCNLTEAFTDRKQVYYCRVTARLEAQASDPVTSEAFDPVKETHLDLPLLNVTLCGRNLCVGLQPPMEDLRGVYETLRYKLRIKGNGAERETEETEFAKGEIFNNLAPGRRYCVSISFSDSLVSRSSNYSQPVCKFAPGSIPAGSDIVISGLLCVLVIFGLVVVALLVAAGYICLCERPPPHVLSSIRHMEEAPVLAPSSSFLSFLLNLEPTPPSSGEKRSSQTSDDSDGESVTECISERRGGGGYQARVGTNLSPSSSCSLPSVSAPLSPEPEPKPSCPSDQTSDFIDPQPVASASAQISSGLRTPTASHSDPPAEAHQCAPDPPADCVKGGKIDEEEEEEVAVGEGSSQDVDLLTLTFGRYDEEEKEEEKPHVECNSASEEAAPMLPAQTLNVEKLFPAVRTVSCPVNEGEEEEDEESGYIGRK